MSPPRGAAASSWDDRLASLQLVVGAIFVVSFVGFAIWARFTVPYRDDWDWLLWVLKRPLTLRRFFEPHNEHVIVLVRVLLVAQYWLEGARSHLIFYTCLLAQFGTGWICLREIRRRWSDGPALRYAAGVSAAILFFSFQLQSFVFMAASVFPLVQFFATAAIFGALTASATSPARAGSILLTAGSCALAVITTTSGLVVPLLVALVFWCRRAPWRMVTGFGLMSIGAAVAYLALAGVPWHTAPLNGPAGAGPGAGVMIAYFLTFFASGMAYANVTAATATGAVLLALGAVAILVTIHQRDAAARLELFAAALMLFAIASVAMATPSRAQFGALQAAQSRYATCSLAYWAGLFLWVVSRFWDRVGAAQRRLALGLTLAISLLALVPHVAIAMVWKAKADNIAAAILPLEAGVADDEWVTTLHPMPAVVYEAERARRAAGDPRSAGTALGRGVELPPGLQDCSAALTLSRVGARRDWRLTGTVAVPGARAVIADALGVARGLARVAPLVDVPSPSEPEVVRAVWRSWRSGDRQPPLWLGFVPSTAAPPYTFVLLDESEQPICRSGLTVAEPVHIWLDQPEGVVGADAAGAGWAFQCDGTIERLTVVIDGVEQDPQRVERPRPRPDVAASFSAMCDVGAAGFGFSLDTRRLPSGRHELKARAVGRGGRTADSNPRVIEVTR